MVASAGELVKNVDSVVSLPSIFTRINSLINNPDSNLVDIADIISEDPGLSVRLLKIANSAMFNFPSEIDTITRAITVIGTKQLRDLVLATQVISIFKNIDQDIIDMQAFWRHCIATGILARIFASLRRESNTEYYYLLGLLHEIGRLVMYMDIPELMAKAVSNSIESNVSLHQSELSVIGFDHAMVGAELMKAWNLPAPMSDAICYHHRPSLSLNYCDDSAIIHVSDLIVNALNLGTSGESDIPQLDEQAWESLELSQFVLSDAIEQLKYQYDEAVKLFLEED